jgi:hypothetical protein
MCLHNRNTRPSATCGPALHCHAQPAAPWLRLAAPSPRPAMLHYTHLGAPWPHTGHDRPRPQLRLAAPRLRSEFNPGH